MKSQEQIEEALNNAKMALQIIEKEMYPLLSGRKQSLSMGEIKSFNTYLEKKIKIESAIETLQYVLNIP